MIIHEIIDIHPFCYIYHNSISFYLGQRSTTQNNPVCATGKFEKSSLLQVQCVAENKYFPIFLTPRRQNFAIKTPAGHRTQLWT